MWLKFDVSPPLPLPHHENVGGKAALRRLGEQEAKELALTGAGSEWRQRNIGGAAAQWEKTFFGEGLGKTGVRAKGQNTHQVPSLSAGKRGGRKQCTGWMGSGVPAALTDPRQKKRDGPKARPGGADGTTFPHG